MDRNNKRNSSGISLKSENNDELSDETKCGFGRWKPDWMQRFATPLWYMVLSNILGILHGAFGMYFVGVMSTIEKRFGFSSKLTGLIIIADNFSPIIFSPITGYNASDVHRPRLIALGMFIVVIACYMNALPFFIYGASHHLLYDSTTNTTEKYEFWDKYESHSHSNRDRTCAELSSKSHTVPALIIFFMSNFLNGIGHNAFYTAGFTYLDDNVQKAESPLFLGLTYAIRLLGPQLGYFLAGYSLKHWENPLYNVDIKQTDPRYVGAWSMGFLILGTLLLIFTFPMALFPKRMPGMIVEGTQVMPKLVAIRLFRNPILLLFLATVVFAVDAQLGYLIFQPKYLENQFRKTSSDASFITGSVGVITSAFRLLLVSLIITKFKARPKFLIIYMIALNYIGSASMLSMWFMGCDNPLMAETSLDNGQMNVTSECNSDCEYTTRQFQPVCNSDLNYFSPCQAGCTHEIGPDQDGVVRFGGCKCAGFGGIVTKGYSFISAPLVFGALSDVACDVWQKTCGQSGQCWLYNIDRFRHLLHGTTFSLLLISSLSSTPILLFVNRVKNFYGKTDNNRNKRMEMNITVNKLIEEKQ